MFCYLNLNLSRRKSRINRILILFYMLALLAESTATCMAETPATGLSGAGQYLGEGTKGAIINYGSVELVKKAKELYPDSNLPTIIEHLLAAVPVMKGDPLPILEAVNPSSIAASAIGQLIEKHGPNIARMTYRDSKLGELYSDPSILPRTQKIDVTRALCSEMFSAGGEIGHCSTLMKRIQKCNSNINPSKTEVSHCTTDLIEFYEHMELYGKNTLVRNAGETARKAYEEEIRRINDSSSEQSKDKDTSRTEEDGRKAIQQRLEKALEGGIGELMNQCNNPLDSLRMERQTLHEDALSIAGELSSYIDKIHVKKHLIQGSGSICIQLGESINALVNDVHDRAIKADQAYLGAKELYARCTSTSDLKKGRRLGELANVMGRGALSAYQSLNIAIAKLEKTQSENKNSIEKLNRFLDWSLSARVRVETIGLKAEASSSLTQQINALSGKCISKAREYKSQIFSIVETDNETAARLQGMVSSILAASAVKTTGVLPSLSSTTAKTIKGELESMDAAARAAIANRQQCLDVDEITPKLATQAALHPLLNMATWNDELAQLHSRCEDTLDDTWKPSSKPKKQEPPKVPPVDDCEKDSDGNCIEKPVTTPEPPLDDDCKGDRDWDGKCIPEPKTQTDEDCNPMDPGQNCFDPNKDCDPAKPKKIFRAKYPANCRNVGVSMVLETDCAKYIEYKCNDVEGEKTVPETTPEVEPPVEEPPVVPPPIEEPPLVPSNPFGTVSVDDWQKGVKVKNDQREQETTRSALTGPRGPRITGFGKKDRDKIEERIKPPEPPEPTKEEPVKTATSTKATAKTKAKSTTQTKNIGKTKTKPKTKTKTKPKPKTKEKPKPQKSKISKQCLAAHSNLSSLLWSAPSQTGRDWCYVSLPHRRKVLKAINRHKKVCGSTLSFPSELQRYYRGESGVKKELAKLNSVCGSK